MKIIDAHLHLFTPGDYTGPVPAGKLSETYGRLNVCAGIVMGNQPLSPDAYNFPPAFRYCVGVGDFESSLEADEQTLAVMEEHLRRPQCVGIKIYAGYAPIYAGDPRLEPYYRLAGKHGKAVAFHTGMTAGSMGRLKYSHPLTLDDAASAFPDVQFVMCHFGNPFLADAAAVLEKNPNMAADISGLLAGYEDLDSYFIGKREYIDMLRGWLGYGDYWDRILFGTDWPGVNLANYLGFIDRLIPDKQMEAVFFDNANRVYRLGL